MVAERLAPGLLAAALVVSGCSGSGDPPAPAPATSTLTSAPSSATSSAPSSISAVEPPPAPARPVTLAFAGDVHAEGPLRARLADPATTFVAPEGAATDALAAADLAVVNLETAVGVGGRPAAGKRFTFRAPPRVLDALAAAGVDVVTMANNHVLDFGRGLVAQARAAGGAAGVDVVGVGRDAAQAFAPAYREIDGTTVAVLGATQAALDPTADPTGAWAATRTRAGTADAVDPRRLLRAVRAVRATDADVVVVFVHWGVQGERCPSVDQQRLARALVRSGADVVVGSHAHVVQGVARVGRGYVAYGLGNFAWYQPSDSGVLTLTVDPADARVTRADWAPAVVGDDGVPRRAGPVERPLGVVSC